MTLTLGRARASTAARVLMPARRAARPNFTGGLVRVAHIEQDLVVAGTAACYPYPAAVAHRRNGSVNRWIVGADRFPWAERSERRNSLALVDLAVRLAREHHSLTDALEVEAHGIRARRGG